MNSYNQGIGGFLQLELKDNGFLHSDAVLLNTARNCLEYVLKTNKVGKVHLPRFICDVMLEPLKKLDVEYSFYQINEGLEIMDSIKLDDNDFLLYINYFGLKDSYSRKLSQIYKNQLILDCSQAFYFDPLKIGHTIYSPRKFFGIPDGGIVYTPNLLDEDFQKDLSYNRFTHLIKRIDVGAEEAYADFKKDDNTLSNQPIKEMSRLTRKILGSIDFDQSKKKRTNNFEFLHTKLKKNNKFQANLTDYTCPMVYPFVSEDKTLRNRLIDKKIFVATYWPNIYEWCNKGELEYKLTEQILPLPIDQRYGEEEMERIVQLVNGS